MKVEINKYIDHTLLKPEATREHIEKLCAEAKDHSFYSVCVNSSRVSLCRELLAGTDVKVCSVVGFPFGAMSTEAKGYETKIAVNDGAEEIDMVVNIGWMMDGEYQLVEDDIRCVVENAGEKAIVKVIIEAALFTDEQIIKLCQMSMAARAAFVKTSTGVNTTGATTHAVSIMKQTVRDTLKVKAAGGIRGINDAYAMIDAGADRLGTSSGVSLVKDGIVSTDY